MGGDARGLVLVGEGRFRCQNSRVGIYELTGFALVYPHGKMPQYGEIQGVDCSALEYLECFFCIEKRLGGYWRKWLKFPGHFARYENSS